MTIFTADVKTVVPCRIEVTYYEPAVPGRYSGEPDDCYPDEPSQCDFEVYTPDGEPAELDQAEADRLYQLVVEHMERGDD